MAGESFQVSSPPELGGSASSGDVTGEGDESESEEAGSIGWNSWKSSPTSSECKAHARVRACWRVGGRVKEGSAGSHRAAVAGKSKIPTVVFFPFPPSASRRHENKNQFQSAIR